MTTDIEQIPTHIADLRRTFHTGRTRSLDWRLAQLRRLKALLHERETEIAAALQADLRKSTFEAWGTEIGFLLAELDYTLKHLASWVQPEKVKAPIMFQPGKAQILQEPLGVVLIMGPWNYPFQLLIAPLIGALAAGNCAVIKPSELAPHTSALVADLLPRYLDTSCVQVLEGGIPETTAILEQRFDHIFFTGGGTVGRIIMTAAAQHLTPVTLELGGKSPCIVDSDVHLKVAARRIVWGKFVNAGQTCIAPDYLLVHKDIEAPLIEALTETLTQFYGPDPRRSPDYPRIINAHHHQRLSALLGDGEIVTGGEADEEDLYIAPTLLRDVSPDTPIMQDEIFGPILPILTVPHIEAAIDFVNARAKPLALYIYSKSSEVQDKVLTQTTSGGVAVNECLMHIGVPELPFGGVGPSGMGAYHGRASFDTFSHRKSVLNKSTRLDPALRYPPYTPAKLKWIKRLL